MEAASSIAGLASLAGLVLEGIKTLRTFCLDFKAAGTDLQETAGLRSPITTPVENRSRLHYITDDLQSLGSALSQLGSVTSQEGIQPSTVTLLRRTVIGCKEDVDKWLVAIHQANYQDKKGISRILKRMNATFDCSRRGELRQKIASHRSQLGLALELFGRDAGNHQCKQLSAIRVVQDDQHNRSMQCLEKSVDKLNSSQASLNNIEARLQSMEKTLTRGVITKSKKTPRRFGHGCTFNKAYAQPRSLPRIPGSDALDHWDLESATRTQRPPEHPHTLMRLVKTAYLVQESNGRPVIEMLATTDNNFESAEIPKKLEMIKYIQGLRLLMWLLRHDNLTSAARFCANDDPVSNLLKNGKLNTGYKRLVVPSEFLRWKQFSLIQKHYSPLSGGAVPKNPVHIIRSYFLSNDYGRDLFGLYLSLPQTYEERAATQTFAIRANNPRWQKAREKRNQVFAEYVSSQKTPKPTPITLPASNRKSSTRPPRKTLPSDGEIPRKIQKCSSFDSAIDLSHDHDVLYDPMQVDNISGKPSSEYTPAGLSARKEGDAEPQKYAENRPSETSSEADAESFSIERETAWPYLLSTHNSMYAGSEEEFDHLHHSEIYASQVSPDVTNGCEIKAAQPLRAFLATDKQGKDSIQPCTGSKRQNAATDREEPFAKRLMLNDQDQAGSAEWLRDHMQSKTTVSQEEQNVRTAENSFPEENHSIIPPKSVSTDGQARPSLLLDDYQAQLKLLEQQNMRRLLMARQEQDRLSADVSTSRTRIDPALKPNGAQVLDHCEAPGGLENFNVLGGWHTQVSQNERAHQSTELFLLLQTASERCENLSFVADGHTWNIAMNVESDFYAHSRDLSDYYRNLSVSKEILAGFGDMPKTSGAIDEHLLNA